MLFTQREFDTMVEELLYTTPARFDTLYQITEKAVRPKIAYWCNIDKYLRGRGYEDDIMHDMHLRMIQTAVPGFLQKDGVDAPVNNDPAGFNAWMRTVAENIKKDYSNRVRGMDFRTVDIDDPLIDCPVSDNTEQVERQESLRQAFSIVLDSDLSVYKVLTWLAQFVIIIDAGVTKIESNDLIVAAFEDKTLYEMYAIILAASHKIPWITVSRQQEEKILKALAKPWRGDVTYGEAKYKAFFMKHNGWVSGKKSISDWMYRMNELIKQKAGGETDPPEQPGP